MDNVLSRTDLGEYDKARQYMQLQNRFLTYKRQLDSIPEATKQVQEQKQISATPLVNKTTPMTVPVPPVAPSSPLTTVAATPTLVPSALTPPPTVELMSPPKKRKRPRIQLKNYLDDDAQKTYGPFRRSRRKAVETKQNNSEATDSGGNSTPTAFTTALSRTGPAPDSFFLSTLRRNCSPDVALSNGSRWEEHIHVFIQRSFSSLNNTWHGLQRYSCKARCGLEQRNASKEYLPTEYSPRCYCDKLCDDFGDCCFDFVALCRKLVNPENNHQTNEICFGLKRVRRVLYPGYAVWNTCPENWKERSVRQRCQDEDQNDLLRNLPVFDNDSHVTYKNIFCARCNGAVNTSYWKIIYDCKEWFNATTFNFSNDMSLLKERCTVDKKPETFHISFLKRCIPRFQDCNTTSQAKNETYCQTECLRYSFPVCVRDARSIRFRNLQCALCNGFKPSDVETECPGSGTGEGGIIPPLTIFFDFTSTSKYSIVVDDRKERVFRRLDQDLSCSLDAVYDPYAGSCKRIVSIASQTGHGLSKENGTEELNPNCTFIAFNKTDYERLPNGTVYVKRHDKIYSNTEYTIRDNRLLLCVNFSRNVTAAEMVPGIQHQITKTPASLHLLTSIGCIVSMVSLVLLLITYILFVELRNLPGKIIINVAFSLLLYQSFFFSAVKTDDQETCLAVAVLLHYFVLSSFTWMNVMAYDVHRTFTNISGVAANRQGGGCTKRLMKYCLYAWEAPAIVVLICVIVDHVIKGSIGYGNPTSNPISQHRTSVALICVKMASVMGVTWILGIAANLKAVSFLWYPYVVLNSLQGLFIFLSFAVSGRALELYRSKFAAILRNRTTLRTGSNSSAQYICSHTDEKQDTRTQETHL
ncbi:hypothetical protein OS493_006355 [Desmophyllum pertusum]|uniref:G-protein coupled receptors family 2 profile 2 domain-containing protein n=1 Tax=Desmophyllum pertusum TaxID=174260 RepID=A0A9X0A885_9CNID|nr:hypothetical protein OS493_006355 [Desmophyllum pertusum]